MQPPKPFRRMLTGLAPALALALFVSPVFAVELLQNGSFENGKNLTGLGHAAVNPGTADLPGWTGPVGFMWFHVNSVGTPIDTYLTDTRQIRSAANHPPFGAGLTENVAAVNLEYALLLNPTGADGAPGTLTGSVLSFKKRGDAMTNGDVEYVIETSPDLQPGSWTPATPNPDDPADTISITLDPSGGGSLFARLKVTQQ
ncbi:MAG: hypothetical protein NTW21_04440 [Verrucomicrobia bacterium]|nr:hypothetical protein [Verrucomicrobiota bacterium]